MWKAETTRWSMGFGRSDVANAITDGWNPGVREGRKTARDATMKIFIGAKLDGFVKSQFCSLSDHLGAFQAMLLNFKNSSQAPQTA